MKYKAVFDVDGGVSQGFGLKESSYYKEEKEFDFDGKGDDKQVIGYAICLGRKISINALSNPNTNLTKVTLIGLYGPNGEIDQKEFILKYKGVKDKKGKSISFKTNELSQIVLEDYNFDKLLRLSIEK